MATDLVAQDMAAAARRRAGFRLRGLPRVGWLGDSLTQFSINSAANIIQWTNVGYVNPLRWLLRGRMQTSRGLVIGVAGVKTDHLLATQVPAAIAAGIDIGFVQIGTNDFGTLTLAQSVANVQAAVTQLNAAGVAVVLIAVAPQNAWAAPIRQSAAEYNRQLYLISLDRARNARFVDINPVFVDYGTGSAISGYLFSDGVHDGPAGSLAKAQRILAAVDDLFPKYAEHLPLSAADAFDPVKAPNGNIGPNAIMAGTGGTSANGGSGTVANNWRLVTTAASTATAAGSKGTDPTYPTLPTQAITLGGTGDSATIRLSACTVNGTAGVAIPSGLNAGDLIYAEAELRWTGLAGAIKTVTLRLEGYTAAVTTSSQDGAQFNPGGTTALPLPPDFAGVYRTDPLAVPAGAIGLGLILDVVPFTGSALSGTITITRVALRKAA